MRDNRVSCIPLERSISLTDPHNTRTVGLAFLTDIMFLLRLPDFHKHLDEPVIKFVSDLNGLEEDLSYSELIGETGLSGTVLSLEGSLTGGLHHAHSHAQSTLHGHNPHSVVGGDMIKKQPSATTTSADLSQAPPQVEAKKVAGLESYIDEGASSPQGSPSENDDEEESSSEEEKEQPFFFFEKKEESTPS